jgi:hypothetical protein
MYAGNVPGKVAVHGPSRRGEPLPQTPLPMEHQTMDLEGVGAVGGAVVAALAVVGSLITGAWSTRGALAQADATHKAALEASANNDKQAHRSTRRDAYGAFLLESTQLYRKSQALLVVNFRDFSDLIAVCADLDRRSDELDAKLVVVQLEGPDSVAEAARDLSSAVIRVSDGRQEYASVRRAQEKLNALMSDASEATLRASLSSLRGSLSRLRRTLITYHWDWQRGELIGISGTNPLSHDIEAGFREVQEIFTQLPPDTFTLYEQQHLLAGTCKSPDLESQKQEYLRCKEAFIRIARTTFG